MTSDRRARLAALAAALSALSAWAAGCGGDLHDLGVATQPLVVIHGHVDLAALTRPHPDAPLLGALVWAEVPAVDPTCRLFDDPRIAAACPDPYGVFNGAVEAWTTIAADGSFDLPLFHLPAVRVSVGDAVTRIAYGSLIAIEEVDGDGQPSLLARASGAMFEGSAPQPVVPDTVVAASFYNLRAPQTRIVFREGGYDTASYFYPLPGCAPPPSGFSILSAPAYSDAPPAGGGCVDTTTETVVEVTPLSTTDGHADTCRPAQLGTGLRQAGDRQPRGNPSKLCLTGAGEPPAVPGTVMDALYADPCPWLQSYALTGCAADPACTTAEWNLTSSPPSWWPCH